jgi:lipopolysaccharide biosynthesis glycosyltransferase
MEKNIIHVAFDVNNEYVKFLSVTITSILSSAHDGTDFCFYILSDHVSDENKRKIEQLRSIKMFQVVYIKISEERYRGIQLSCQYDSVMNKLYRILIASLLPSHLEKVIYLDSDLCVLKDLSTLWNIDIGTNSCTACVPDQEPFLSGDYILTLPLDKEKRYFNTGVQLINLKIWRTNNIEKQLFETAIYYNSLLVRVVQDTLNIVLKDKIYPLTHNWNAMPGKIYALESEEEEAFSDTCIMHWAGWEKPWIFPHAKYADIFFKYARMTPFYEEIIFENFRFGELYYRSDRQRADFEAQRNRQRWLLQKLRGFRTCWKDHGLLYTIGLFIKKCLRRFKKG